MTLHHRLIESTTTDHGSDKNKIGPLVLAHGFTQNTECWGRFGELLAATADVVVIDGPGHGRSHHDDADLPTAANLMTEVGGRAVYIGYSMGGRVALHAALQNPQLVDGLVLIGATAGLEDPAERAARRALDAELAAGLLRDGLDRFMDRWLASPLFAGLDDTQAAKPQRLKNRPEGLAASLNNCGTGTQEPLWDRLGELEMPVLIVAGEQDEKFTKLGRRMAEAMTNSSVDVLIIPGTHAVHLEEPELTAESILAIIKSWQ